ncbi:MAG: hypothetical protein JW774_13375, partial [Candidatus Aureabacteria bacterium]|nr:hypothetical protein [Candidatus Auribacterota bacterium]
MFHRFLLILILCVQSVPAQEDRLQSGFETDPDIKRNIISLAAAVMNEKTDISLSQYIPSGKLELKDSFFLYHRRLRFSDGTGKAFTLPFVYQNRLYLAAGFDKRERTAQLRELLNHYFRPLDYYEWEMPENNCVLVAKLDAVSLAKGDDQMRKEEAEKIFLQHGFVHPFERFFFRTALHIALTGNLFVKEEAPLPVESPNPGIKTACLCKGPYADQINNLVAGILRLSDTATHIPPSLVNHPTLEKIAFLYDASVVALILDAAGKKEEAERILDYFHCILQTDLAQLPSKLDSDNIYGIVKLYKGRDGRMRKALLNALNVDCFLNQGEGMLEFYTTPGPNSFLY